MKNKQIFAVILSIALLVIITACGKKPDDPIVPPVTTEKPCKPDTIFLNSLPYFLIEYNSDRKISKITIPSASAFSTFIYKGDSIINTHFSTDMGNPVISGVYKYVVDKNGNIIWEKNTSGGIIIKTYTYDADGYLKKELTDSIFSQNTVTVDYTVVNGNYTKAITTYSNSTNSDSVAYEYYIDKENKGTSFISYTVSNNIFPTGKQSKNMHKKTTFYESGVLSQTLNYTYIYNTEGYASKVVEEYTFSSNIKHINIIEYTYNCN